MGAVPQFVLDESEHRLALQAEGVDRHLVVALAAAGVAGVELAAGRQRGLEPQTGEVQDAERAGGAGTDEENECCHWKQGVMG